METSTFTPSIPSKKRLIPDGFSFPVGSSAISEALAGLPMFSRFTLTMVPPPMPDGPLTLGSSIPVMRLVYSNYPAYTPKIQTNIHVRQGGERWDLELYAVPREWRNAIKEQLIEKGLPLFREWFSSPEFPAPDSKKMSMTMWLEPNGEFSCRI